MIIRAAKPSDQPYVCTTWIKSVHEYSPSVDRVLDRRACRIKIAHPPGNLDRIEGWLCYEVAPRFMLLHMAYVRPERRRRGIATQLLEAAVGGRRLPLVITARKTQDWREEWVPKATTMELQELWRP